MNFFDKKTIELIRSQSAKAEKDAKIPKEWLKVIYEKKFFKLFVPETDGGLMMPLPEALRLFDEAAFVDGNLGWAITIGSGGGYFYGFMQPEVAKKVFNRKTAVIAGSGAPGIAKRVKGGYKVNGRWKYCSGSSYATSFTANVKIDGKDIRAFIFEPKQVKIHKDWNAFGMKATESHSISAENIFVPEEMTFDITGNPIYAHPFYKYPFLQFAETSFAALSLGMGRHFFAEANEIIEESKKYWSVDRYKFVKKLIKENESEFNEMSSQFYRIANDSWLELLKRNSIGEQTKSNVSIVSKTASRVVLKNIDAVIQYLGMNAVMENTDINRIWRDAHTACQHVLLVPLK